MSYLNVILINHYTVVLIFFYDSLFYFLFTEVYECPSTHSKCQNHFCVPRDVLCNFKNDCGDGSDEENCGKFYVVP